MVDDDLAPDVARSSATMIWNTGLAPDILKVESWTQMGRTANIIIKYSIHVFASIYKNMRILLMGRRYRERRNMQNQWVLSSARKDFNYLCQLSVRESNFMVPKINSPWQELISRDYFVNAPSQWETALHCNVFSNRMAWQWAETLVEIRVILADIRGTTK